MKLKRFLQLNQKFSPKNTLKQNLGDGFLITHNPVFNRIRKVALKEGFRFSSDRFHDFSVLPLTQLPAILAKKIVPYHDNVSPLLAIEAQMPNSYDLAEVPPLLSNYVMHESAHGIARSLRNRLVGKNLKKQDALVLAILLEESFANACESLANLFSDSPLHNEFLFRNCYMIEDEATRKVLRTSRDIVGVVPTFKLLVLSFLHANYLRERLSGEDLIRTLRLALKDRMPERQLNQRQLGVLKRVVETGLDLDPEFTRNTNAFCLRLMGVKGKFPACLAGDFLGQLESNAKFQKLLEAFSEVII